MNYLTKYMLGAGLALATGAAFAAVNQDFDEISDLPDYIKGDGKIENQALVVEGRVRCANDGTASEHSKSSFKVQVPVDGDAPEALTGDDASCQVAVATGEASGDNLKLMVWCKGLSSDDATAAGWVDSGKTVAKSSSPVINLAFDYTAKTVEVLVGTESAGTYHMASAPAETTAKVASLDFVGSSTVDDVKIQEAVATSATPGELVGLKPIYLDDMGITSEELRSTTKDTTGLTVADRILAGLDPKGETAFAATAMDLPSGGDVKITIPYEADNGQAYQVVVTDKAGTVLQTLKATPADPVNGKATLTVKPTATAKVLMFQVQAVAPQAQTAQN